MASLYRMSDSSLSMYIEDVWFEVFENMQSAGYERETGKKALTDVWDSDAADMWTEWWDEGED